MGCKAHLAKGKEAIKTDMIRKFTIGTTLIFMSDNRKDNARMITVYFCSGPCVRKAYKRLQDVGEIGISLTDSENPSF